MAKSYSQFGLFTLNLLFWFFGAALVAVGIYSAHVGSLSSIQPYSVQWASVILGSSIFLISLLGCLGSCQESKFLLRLYFLILLFLLTAQCGLALLAYHQRVNLPTIAQKGWAGLNTEAVNGIERELQCCGYYSREEVLKSPENICSENSSTVDTQDWESGCIHKIGRLLSKHIRVLEVVVEVLALVQFLALLMSYHLLKRWSFHSEYTPISGNSCCGQLATEARRLHTEYPQNYQTKTVY
eukprot:Sdes_comp10141_c0_seq1m1754